MIPVVLGGVGRRVIDLAPSLASHPKLVVVDTDSRSSFAHAFANHCKDEITGGVFWDADAGVIQNVLKSLRRAATQSDEWIVLMFSAGGATGSGGAVHLVQAIHDTFRSTKRAFCIALLPDQFGRMNPFELTNAKKFSACVSENVLYVEKLGDMGKIWEVVASHGPLEKFSFAYVCRTSREVQQVIRKRNPRVGLLMRFSSAPDPFLSVPAGLRVVDLKPLRAGEEFIVLFM